MKKSLRRKLIMSLAAVGVAVAGTSAATYAWFVTNSTVSSTVTGSVVSSDSSLYIGDNASAFGTNDVNINMRSKKLAPLQAISENSGFSFKNLNGSDATENDYIKYSLYFSVQNVYSSAPKKITMKTEAIDKDYASKSLMHTAQANVAASGTYKEIKTGEKYWENVLKTLNMNISYVTHTDSTQLDTSLSYSEIGNYMVNSTASEYDGLTYYKNVNGLDTLTKGASVITPNNSLTNNDIDDVSQAGKAQGTIDLLTNITASGYYKVDFTIWLDGWDEAGFDAVASHEFDIKLTFALENYTA